MTKNIFGFNIVFSRIMSLGAIQRQSIISFLNQISFTLIGFLSTMYFAHILGASILGTYFLFTAYYDIVSMVSDGGFGGAAIKRISEGEEQDAYFSAFFLLRSSLILGVILALVIFRSHFNQFDNNIFIFFILALVASLFYGSVSNGIEGQGKIGVYSVCNFINNVSRIIIQVILVFLGYEIGGLAGGFVAGLFIATIIEFHFFDLHLSKFEWRHVKSLSIFSFWLFLTSGGVMLYSYIDTIMIGYYLGSADVGVYRAIYQFTTISVLTATVLRSVLWPKISRWGKIGEKNLIEKSLSCAFGYSFLLAVPVLAGGIILGEKLLYYLYGAEFIRGYPVLIVLLFTQLVNVLQLTITGYLGALDYQKESFKVTAVACIANVIINLILIPLMGIMGAAIATLVTMSLNAILAWKLLSRIINPKIDSGRIKNILKASVIMTLFVGGYCLLIPLSSATATLLPVIIGGVIYVLLVLKFDEKMSRDFKHTIMKLK